MTQYLKKMRYLRLIWDLKDTSVEIRPSHKSSLKCMTQSKPNVNDHLYSHYFNAPPCKVTMVTLYLFGIKEQRFYCK